MSKKSRKSTKSAKSKTLKKDYPTPEEQTQIALAQCRAEFEGSLQKINKELKTKVTASREVIASFATEFEADFLAALKDINVPPSPTFPENAWALTRTKVMLKVHAITALAVSFALDHKQAAISRDHLSKAVLTVKPNCEITTHPPRRFDFCAGFGGMLGMSPTGMG